MSDASFISWKVGLYIGKFDSLLSPRISQISQDICERLKELSIEITGSESMEVRQQKCEKLC